MCLPGVSTQGAYITMAKTNDISRQTEPDPSLTLEMEKLKLERSKQRTEVLKWIVIAIGAVVSFFVIDFGRLQLEKFQATAENESFLSKSKVGSLAIGT